MFFPILFFLSLYLILSGEVGGMFDDFGSFFVWAVIIIAIFSIIVIVIDDIRHK